MLSSWLIVNGIVDDLPAAETPGVDVDATLVALADPVRRRVVELLGVEPLRAGDIAGRTGMTPAAMSRHLRVLRRAGIVEVDTPGDDARVRLYRLRPEGTAALRAWLDQVAAFWSEQLGSFAEHAERTRGRGRGRHRGGRGGGRAS